MLQYIEFHGESHHGSREPLGEKPRLSPTATIRDCRIGSFTAVGSHTSMRESSMDDYSYITSHCSCVWTKIGKYCSIASHTRINPGNHPVWRVTTSHATYRRRQYGWDTVDDDEFFDWRKAHHCTIGHDVWIGHGVVVTAGAAIGTGACIGAGAVVTRDIPPYAIAVGVPAKVIKYRFDEKTIEKLQEIAFWDWSHEQVRENFRDLLDVPSFIEKYG